MRLAMLFFTVFLLVACTGAGDTATSIESQPGIASTTSSTSTSAPPIVATTGQAATTTTAATHDITMTGEGDALIIDGPERFEFVLGETVSITVLPSITDEIHVHGYDVTVDLEPGKPVILEFRADVPGVFEVELEQLHRLLFELVVR